MSINYSPTKQQQQQRQEQQHAGKAPLPALHWTPTGLVETSYVSQTEVRQLEEQREASHAEAAPLGLFGFALGTFVASMVISDWYPASAMVAIIPAVLIFAGFGQFIAGLLSFNRGSTFGGTTFCSYGAGNIIIAAFLWMQHAGLIPVCANDQAILRDRPVLLCLHLGHAGHRGAACQYRVRAHDCGPRAGLRAGGSPDGRRQRTGGSRRRLVSCGGGRTGLLCRWRSRSKQQLAPRGVTARESDEVI